MLCIIKYFSLFQYIVLVITVAYSRVHFPISADTSINMNLRGSTIGGCFIV